MDGAAPGAPGSTDTTHPTHPTHPTAQAAQAARTAQPASPAGAADWRRPLPTARQRRLDLLVGTALGAGTVASVLLSRAAGVELARTRPSLVEEVLWCLAVSLPLVVRRRYPLATLTLVAAAFVGLQARFVAETQLSSVCLFLALFTAGAWGRDRTLTRAVRLVVVVVMFAWLAYSLSATAWAAEANPDRGEDGGLAAATAAMIWVTAVNVLYFGAAWFFGDLAFQQARQHDLLEARTVELARERDENARRAVLEERVRIARELHDVVAHHVSVMGVQAGAARLVLDRDAEAARTALARIEAGARSAVEEMHRLLGVLRERDGEAGPPGPPVPDLDAVPSLLERARQTGLEVTYAVVGEPRPVPEGMAVSAYRILQEALTNTVRHAAATRADVRVRYLDRAFEVEVVDDGRGPLVAAAAPAGLRAAGPDGSDRAQPGNGRPGPGRLGSGQPGLGQVGMRERVALHDGELDLGPRAEGGYRVRARFPLAAVPAP